MRRLLTALLLVLSLPFAALSGCIGVSDGVSFRDVHGLGVHPEDPGVVFVATHHGLWKGGDGGWSRVGESKDDLMGFTMHPTDANVMWSSGHPPADSGGPTSLGIRRSDDGGLTWRAVSMPNLDFHVMAASPARPDVLYASQRNWVYRSEDGGATMVNVAAPGPRLAAMAGHPERADTVYGTDGENVVVSADGGGNWSVLARMDAAWGIAVKRDGTLLVATGAGVVISNDEGRTWRDAGMEVPKERLAHVAVSHKDPAFAWAATVDGEVFRSVDGGATWTRVKGPG